MPAFGTNDPSIRFRFVVVTEWRKDGWPLCPICGDDELYSQEIPATVETICACYRCGLLALANPKREE